MIYFTADTHFSHQNVIAYENRPFQTAEEMDVRLLQNWNAKISPGDDVYILGDFTLKGPLYANQVLEQLHGRKYLVRGNHDQFAGRASFKRELFVWIKDYYELSWGGYNFVLCHYPLLSWNGMRRGAFQLHGHQHNGRAYNEHNREQGIAQLDMGVDANSMAPVSIADLIAFWETEHRREGAGLNRNKN